MDRTAREFAEDIRRNVDTPTALIIGYDGGASLLNHARPFKTYDELLNGHPAGRSGSFDSFATRTAYARENDKRGFMKLHTAPADSDAPDERAVEFIAALLKYNYVQAVVISDTNGTLRDELIARGVALDLVEAAGCYTVALRAREARAGREVKNFIDGGDLLLEGFLPNMFGLDIGVVRGMHAGLKNFLDSYPRIYCWGWCDFNVQISAICPERAGAGFTAIGRYTARSIKGFPDIDIVYSKDEEGGNADNNIFYELSDHLFGARQPRKSGQLAGPRRAPEVPRAGDLPRVLLTEEVKAALAREVGKRKVSFIGVGAELVRERLAQWLFTSWQIQGTRPQFLVSSNARILACRATVSGSGGDVLWLVAVIDGGGGDGRQGDGKQWDSILLPHVRQWLKRAGEMHVVIFSSSGTADWAGQTFTDRDSVWVQSFTADELLAEGGMVEWLRGYVSPLLDGGLDHSARSLARHMLEPGDSPPDPDWVHVAVDQWYQGLLGTQERPDADDDEPALTVENLYARWDNLRERYAQAETLAIPADFGISVRDAPGDDSFSINVIPRASEEDSPE